METIDFKEDILPMSGRMLRFAEQLLGDGEAAKDVVQDTFLKLWQKPEMLGPVSNPQAFVMKMIRNRCLDLIRARRTTGLDEATERTLRVEMRDERDALELADTAETIRKLISHLPDQQQTVMFLRDIESREYDEIELITGMNVNAIRVNLSRARKKVRDELVKKWNYETDRGKAAFAKIF